jgi:hypothetical protein
MDDFKIEDALRRYHPSGPPPDLRRRALAPPAQRVWPWAAAAAALCLLIVGIDKATDAVVARAGIMPAPDPDALAAESLAEALGSGSEARAVADLVIARQRWQAQTSIEPDASLSEGRTTP